MAKATSLLKAYHSEGIPPHGGFIVSVFFKPKTAYAIYEITAYRNVKDIFKSGDGLNFKTDGNRTHILFEPASFSKKHMEPVNREDEYAVPYRFNEMETISTRKGAKIMIPIEPMVLHSSFTILDGDSGSYSFIFHPTEDVYGALKKFIADSLFNDCALIKSEAIEIATKSLTTIKKFTIFNG